MPTIPGVHRPGLRRLTSDARRGGRASGIPIRSKLVLGVMALFVLPSVFLSVLLPRWQSKLAARHVEEKAGSLVQLLAHAGAAAVAGGEPEAVRRSMAGAFNLSEILVVRVRDERGRPLFTYDPLVTPLPNDVPSGSVRSTDDLVVATHPVRDADGETVGDLAVALTLDGVHAEARRARWMGVGAGILVLLLGLPLAVILARRITGPLTEVADVVAGIQGADGWDLTRRVPVRGGDETADLADGVNAFLGELQRLVRTVQRTAFDTDRHTRNIEETITRLSHSAGALDDGIEEISSGSAAQVAATAKNAEGARGARELAERILERAEETAIYTGSVTEAATRGHRAASEATAAIDRIAEVTRESRDVVGTLEENAREIDRVLEAIGNLSRQTRLLAFNASIEAVREGAKDSGFGVVVEEVGKLAQQTQDHAREIGEAVSAIGHSVRETVDRVERIEEAVTAGRTVIDELEALLGDVRGESADTARAAERIAELGEEQRRALVEVVDHADEVARIAGQHEAASTRMAGAVDAQQAATRETARLASELSELAADLTEQIRKFRVTDAPTDADGEAPVQPDAPPGPDASTGEGTGGEKGTDGTGDDGEDPPRLELVPA